MDQFNDGKINNFLDFDNIDYNYSRTVEITIFNYTLDDNLSKSIENKYYPYLKDTKNQQILDSQIDSDYNKYKLYKECSSLMNTPGESVRKIRRLAANARERKRMYKLNEAFERLKSVIPMLSSERNLSKFETLQLARTYIAALLELLKR